MFDFESTFYLSDSVVERLIDGEVLIIPVISGISDTEGDLFSLNGHGTSIWKKIKEKKCVSAIISELSAEYDEKEAVIENDVLGFINELTNRKIIKKIE